MLHLRLIESRKFIRYNKMRRILLARMEMYEPESYIARWFAKRIEQVDIKKRKYIKNIC